jgi:hypothetical protein
MKLLPNIMGLFRQTLSARQCRRPQRRRGVVLICKVTHIIRSSTPCTMSDLVGQTGEHMGKKELRVWETVSRKTIQRQGVE